MCPEDGACPGVKAMDGIRAAILGSSRMAQRESAPVADDNRGDADTHRGVPKGLRYLSQRRLTDFLGDAVAARPQPLRPIGTACFTDEGAQHYRYQHDLLHVPFFFFRPELVHQKAQLEGLTKDLDLPFGGATMVRQTRQALPPAK